MILSYEDSPKRIDMRAEAMGAPPDAVLVTEKSPLTLWDGSPNTDVATLNSMAADLGTALPPASPAW